MKVLDLFSGLEGFSQAFKDKGHEVVTVDIQSKFSPTIVHDIMTIETKDLKTFGPFDVILASPPCDCFSVASIYRHWDKERKMPKDQKTIERIGLVLRTIELIHELSPRFWVLENPRGMLRKIIGFPHYEITQCQYGHPNMKPTDLWGRLPKSFKAKRCKSGADCHAPASRGSQKGTQAIIKNKLLDKHRSSEIRSKIPYGLSFAICEACE